ncbi:MAG TPA: ComEA family DNA-binding protein [Acidimicrobiia bacterium]
MGLAGGNTKWGVGLCLVAIVIGAGLGLGSGTPAGLEASAETPSSTEPEQAASISVHVSGWVVRPGVVEIPEGSIVADAVGAAGGARSGALLDAINLAAPVLAGDQVVVPGPDDEVFGSPPRGEDGHISLNRADATQLQDLPGVGPVLAERIVAYREANGPFQTVEDLLDVPGIGEAKLAAMRDLISVP